ncbi:MAG: adenylate/guanylate cyclase domain-containing protein [Gammaproteobacteria bacterium]|nr:adenylate/guanylate cyclase domain-containing protein [Gammaproteobacteria bacterium]
MKAFAWIAKAHNWLAGSDAGLPLRVREDLRRRQEETEILIGWFQLAIVTLFFVLYAASPKTFSSEAAFAPVPWVLSVYFVFTVARLYLAHIRRLPYWVLLLSVVMDIALLLGLIWSFHLQYQQPPSFYLKAPTLIHIFIFIALRALRLEPGFVLMSGLVAAGGWLLLVAYAVGAPAELMITRNYVEYMTSNSVLIGAEIDKVMAIVVVTAILTFAIGRGRALLVRSIVDRTAAEDLSRFAPQAVVRQMQSSDARMELGHTEVREATIFFTDLESFTSISESLSPPKLVQVLNEYFAVVSKPLEEFGGAINQFQGDAILASFNLPNADPQHAANAIRAALAIQEALRGRTFAGGTVLRSRIGINTGTVVGGLVGTPDRVGYTVHGDDVNIAARLEQMNKEHGTRILVAEKTCQAAGAENFPFRKIGAVSVRGRSSAVNIYTLDA